MQSIRRTTAGSIHATDSFGYRGFGFTHTAPATVIIADGAGNEISRGNIGTATGGADGEMLPSALLKNGLQVVSITAGAVLFIYIE